MSKLADIETWKPKRLRTLRNNLNNRISNFESSDGKGKELQKSHILFGLSEQECRELLKQVQKLIKEQKS
ncbi:MAG: hypothetical protein GY909_18650 [Oligoflexia bacterium]|nr:hypothetical protein [Oligoflexia bacterium]